MADTSSFSGFTKETVRFFEGLKRNNTREWFTAHRETYDKHVLEPAKAFVVAMGEKLRTAVPRIVAVPQVNRSIFRLNRDTRFSQDPTPYKINLGLFFWEGASRMESPGFYVHLEPPDLFLGGGAYVFSDSLLTRYRRAAADPKLGKELGKIVAELGKREGYEIGGKHYKRVPAGYDPASPNAELLKHNGLHAGRESRVPAEFFSGRLIDYCFERFDPLFPLHRWLVKLAR